MKFYFLLPGKELINGLVFLSDGSCCVKMADYICVGGVADVYVEYHGEEDKNDNSSGSDYEDEIIEESGDEPHAVITDVEPAESDTNVLIPDETGVITQWLWSPMKQRRSNIGKIGVYHDEMRGIEGPFSQVLNPTHVASAPASETLAKHVEKDNADSDSDSDSEYIGHTNDSGEDT
ncbi:hypothetical protein D1007_09738 [Hordeum vulgare]|nr:hypothetical protein D1007_09738 [Hordeum vulgare]